MSEHNLDGITVPKLEDDAPVTPVLNNKPIGLDDIAAPTLDGGDDYVKPASSAPKGLDDITAPTLDATSVKPSSPVEAIPENLNDISVPKLADNTPVAQSAPVQTAEKKSLDDIKGAVLDEPEPAPAQEYKPQFVDPTVEAAKKNSLNNSIQGELSAVPSSKDDKKSLEMYKALMAEQRADNAKKGGKTAVLLMVFGLISNICFYCFLNITAYKSGAPDIVNTLTTIFTYICGASALLSILLIVKSIKLKGFCSFILGIMTVVSVGGGGYLLTAKESMVSNLPFWAVAVALNIIISVKLAANENLDLYYKEK